MSSSPVLALRSLQSLIKQTTGAEVPLLDLSKALVLHLRGRVHLELSYFAVDRYCSRLQNWKIADQLVIERFHPIRLERPANVDDLLQIYSEYVIRVESLGLVPMKFNSFRQRAYQIPVPRRPSKWKILPGAAK